MAGSTGSGAADPVVISRRDAIIGALALAAGTLIASKPDVAFAAMGETVVTGGGYFVDGATSFLGPSGNDVFLCSNGTGDVRYSLQAQITGGGDGSAAVRAFSNNWNRIAVHASNNTGTGTAIKAEAWAGIAVDANDGNGGTALRASSSGVGLDVTGKVKLSRSGKATIARRHSTLTVTVPSGIAEAAMIMVTLQGSGGSGVYLKYAKRMSATTFKVALNKKATSAVTFAWMILD
jgi:hypothetical protein